MRHLPNLLTLGNLLCGCIAIAFILNAQPFQVLAGQDVAGAVYYSVPGIEQACLGSLFIGLAAFCDLLDGYTARALNVLSPIGKDLDSLADLVSFGVAPSMILFKMLWAAGMAGEGALDMPMLATVPAFGVACFAALRLARFNITPPTKGFTGMPTPATGVIVASFPLMSWYRADNAIGMRFQEAWTTAIQERWVIYGIVAALCWLMVSKLRFFKLMPSSWKLQDSWRNFLVVLVPAALAPFIWFAAIPLAFLLYIALSLTTRAPHPAEAPAAS